METKEILKSLRKSKGFTNMKDFCEAIDISVNTYQNYESGKRIPTADILIKLADFYGVTTDYLLGRPEAKLPESPIDEFAKAERLKELEKII
ncbi:MAG: helix-turn-helix domain-containing protein, partial [Ruminococcus sp.]|nr:helix-turn-helix domain-containing protein [Ruminococcus sp.]